MSTRNYGEWVRGRAAPARTSQTRTGLTMTAVVAMFMLLTAMPAVADEIIVDQVAFDFFYEDSANELILVTGPPFAEGCLGEGFETTTRYSRLEDDGTYSSKMKATGVHLELFVGYASFGELIEEACGAVAMGLEPPPAAGIGQGSWEFKSDGQTVLAGSSFEPAPEGTHTVNTASGIVTFDDGSAAWVQGAAEWTALADGAIDIAFNDVRMLMLP